MGAFPLVRGIRESDLSKVAWLVLVMAGLQLLIPQTRSDFVIHPLVIVELLGIPLLLLLRRTGELRRPFRWSMTGYLGLLVGASVLNALMLLAGVIDLAIDQPVRLLFGGFTVVAINFLSFGIIYWWLDAGDPAIRAAGDNESPDLLFPQQVRLGSNWQPTLFDYLYVSFTNLLAFSPTDTMPLRHRTKLLFMLQATISTFTTVVIVGHAINALPG